MLRTSHGGDNPSVSSRSPVSKPPQQRRTQGQNHLRRHNPVRRDTRWTTHFRAKQCFRLGPSERNDIVILRFCVPRIVKRAVWPMSGRDCFLGIGMRMAPVLLAFRRSILLSHRHHTFCQKSRLYPSITPGALTLRFRGRQADKSGGL